MLLTLVHRRTDTNHEYTVLSHYTDTGPTSHDDDDDDDDDFLSFFTTIQYNTIHYNRKNNTGTIRILHYTMIQYNTIHKNNNN